MISETTIASIAASSHLSEVAGDYFPVKRRGGRFVALCPFHAERTPSFFINDSKGYYKCFGCGAAGSIFRFVMEMERISFPEAVRKLGARVGIEVAEEESESDKLRKKLESAIHKANASFFNLLIDKQGAKARKILKERGFTKEICQAWDIGYAPDRYILAGDNSIHSMSGLTYDNGTLRFTQRIMFGIRNESGCLVGFSGRTIVDHPAKYLNSPDSAIFHKGKLLYGLDRAKRSAIDKNQLILVEGQIDCIRCHLAGITNVVAPLGTGFTAHHGNVVKRICSEAVLIFDSDKAGQEAARKAFAGLTSLGVRVKAIMLPPKSDPDEFILGGGDLAKEIEQARSYPEALALSLAGSSMEEKQVAIHKVGFALSCMDDGIERDELATRISKTLGIKPSQLKKQAAMGGGHKSIPTESVPYGTQRPLSFYDLVAHLLHCGKAAARNYDWSLVDQDIQIIMETEYEPANPSSIARVLSKLDSATEAMVAGLDCNAVKDIDIRAIYRGMLEAEIKRRADGGKMLDLLPLLTTLKSL